MKFDNNWRAPSGPARTRPHSNLMALRIAVVALFLILALQLFRMQIVDGAEYARRSEENHITQRTILPTRGLIYDRSGEALVANVGVFAATITPEFLPDSDEERYRIYLALEDMLGVPALSIQQRVQAAFDDETPFIEIPIQKYLPKEQALALEEASADMPGVSLSVKPGRSYIAGTEFSAILGYTGDQTAESFAVLKEDGYALNEPYGKEGLEAVYESELRGKSGITAAEQDAQGRLIQSLETIDPEPGNSVRLSVDAGLQRFVSQLLVDSLAVPGDAKNGASTKASAVVMNAKTGELYAIVSVPTYDNNLFNAPDANADAIDALLSSTDIDGGPLLNRALVQAAPGSTFKLVTAAAALQTGRITPATGIDVPSTVRILTDDNGQPFELIDWAAHGYVNLYSGIARSSNMFFYQASCGILGESKGLGKNDEESATILAYYSRKFGFGSPTGVDLGGEFSGIVPDPAWKKRVHERNGYDAQQWYYSDTCYMAIGQGDVTATPLQVARMTAAVANGGKLLTPHVANAIVSPDGELVRQIEPEWTGVPVDAQHLADIRRGMHDSVNTEYGAGARGAVPGMIVAGKTGTAEFMTPDGGKYEHAWYTGFAPYDDPEIVVTVYFDRGIGGNKAAPVAAHIMKYFFDEVQR